MLFRRGAIVDLAAPVLARCRGGATVLKVGHNFASGANEKKFRAPSPFSSNVHIEGEGLILRQVESKRN